MASRRRPAGALPGTRAARVVVWTGAWLVAAVCAPLATLAAQDGDAPTRGVPYAAVGPDVESDTVAPPLSREFRAVWVATVANIDWPSKPGLPVETQRAELLALIERAAELRLNAIVFQVRPAADALYPSRLEPWSYFLTGRQGRPPSPSWDPLAFAITESHRRGMELHAWFNPYRSRHPADTTRPASPLHISRTNPTVVHRYGPYGWMDPGNAFVRRRTLDVVVDVVRRYDVDGVHIDDYFYPYPETRRGREIPFPDEQSWRAYKAREGTLSRDDWRRRNVDLLVEELYTAIKRTKPWVKFGISPFGIWRPGYPSMVRGFDAYEKLYADSRKWLREGWLDYWTPQLYWRLSAPAQPYADLLRWWREENPKGRHVWPGNYTGRASAARRTTWPVDEILDQIRESRAQLSPNSGNVHFSWDAFKANRDSLNERLVAGPYAEPALVPPSPWLAIGLPDPPLVVRLPQPRLVELSVRRASAPVTAEGQGVRPADAPPPRPAADRTQSAPTLAARASRDPHWWLVRARYNDAWYARLVPAWQETVRLPLDEVDAPPSIILVSAIDHAGQESPAAVVR